MKLKEAISLYTIPKLVNVCRTLNIKGFSTLKIQALQDLVYQNIKVQDTVKNIVNSLSDLAISLLAIIVKLGKISNVSDIHNLFSQNFTHSRFSPVLKKLLDLGLLFSMEENEKDQIIIPDEFFPWFQQIISDNDVSIEEEVNFEEPAIETVYRTFDAFLYSSWVSIDELRLILEDNSQSIDGSKGNLIARILYNIQIKPKEILEKLFFLDDLRELASNLKLTKGGNKGELINKIVDVLPLKFSPETYTVSIDPESDDLEEKSVLTTEKPPTLIKFFSSDVIDASKIRIFMEKNDIDSVGTRKEIVKRLLIDSQIPLPNIFDQLFNGDELKDICSRYGWKKGGKKGELIQRIIESLPTGNIGISVQSINSENIQGAASISTDKNTVKTKKTVPSYQIKSPPINKEVKSHDELLADEIFNMLQTKLNNKKNLDKTFKNLRDLINSLAQYIEDLYKVSIDEKRKILIINEGQVLIFCTVAKDKSDVRDFSDKFMGLPPEISKSPKIAIIWDIGGRKGEQGVVDGDHVSNFQDLTKNRTWFRSKQEFSSEVI